MYCTNCGKQINYHSNICVECARAQAGGWQNGAQNGAYQAGDGSNAYESYYSFEPIDPNVFGTQHTSYGTARPRGQTPAGGGSDYYKRGLGRAIVAAVLAQLAAIFISVFLEELELLIAGVLLAALPCAIVALCLGIASIKCFREARRTGTGLPIPTLIIGIHAVANASLALLLCLLSFAFLV